MSKTKTPELVGVPLKIEVTNPKRKSKHTCPCIMPLDCVGMQKDEFDKSYGPHIVQAVYDLLQHESFKQGLGKSKLVLVEE